MNMLTPEKIRFQALSLRLRADEARAESQAADAALAKAGELAKVAKVAAKETEEAAQEAELKALKLPSLQELVVDDGHYGVDHPQLKAACQGRGITLDGHHP